MHGAVTIDLFPRRTERAGLIHDPGTVPVVLVFDDNDRLLLSHDAVPLACLERCRNRRRLGTFAIVEFEGERVLAGRDDGHRDIGNDVAPRD